MAETKICSKCGEEKLVGEFHKRKASRDGLEGKCKPCVRDKINKRRRERWANDKTYRKKETERGRDWKNKNKEKNTEYRKKRHREIYGNPELKKKYQEARRIYLSKNADKIEKARRVWYKKTIEKRRMVANAYYQKNKEKLLKQRKTYRSENKASFHSYYLKHYQTNKKEINKRSMVFHYSTAGTKGLLKRQLNLTNTELTPSKKLIECKHAQLTLKRKIREIRKGVNT
jgi:hypothetical protein